MRAESNGGAGIRPGAPCMDTGNVHAHDDVSGDGHRHDASNGDETGHHHHAHALTGARLRTAFLLTMLILAVEVTGGLLSHSLALISDGAHVLTDIAALGLAWFATVQAGRPADARKTYGYHRTGILAALANAVTLILIVVVIAYAALDRLRHPEQVTPWLMFAAAAVGIVVNLYIAAGLRQEGDQNLNTRAALLHVLGDIGASVGVIAGGAVILLTGWYVVDPLISLFIAALIARGAWTILGETVSILMEGTPRGVDVSRLARDVTSIPTVTDVHDLHVWSIAGGMTALSAHVLVRDDCSLSDCDGLLTRVNALLADRYRITHTTIQFEYDCCGRHDGADVYCLAGDAVDGRASCEHAQRGELLASK
jgi:cobalt-zinc-cadmium efflux system protein